MKHSKASIANTERRLFVKNGALALLALGLPPDFLLQPLLAGTRGSDRKKTLICIFQRGAVDGLSMVIPFGEPAYYDSRRSIAIRAPGSDEGSALDLDGFFGLHPALKPLEGLYGRNEMAIVQAVGSPHPTRSHFDAPWRKTARAGPTTGTPTACWRWADPSTAVASSVIGRASTANNSTRAVTWPSPRTSVMCSLKWFQVTWGPSTWNGSFRTMELIPPATEASSASSDAWPRYEAKQTAISRSRTGLGTRPTISNSGSPFLKKTIVGIERIPKRCEVSGAWSELTFTTRTPRFACSIAISSRIGPIIRHGPHQGAQKSTIVTPGRSAIIASKSSSVA
jgi:hypothetical protein